MSTPYNPYMSYNPYSPGLINTTLSPEDFANTAKAIGNTLSPEDFANTAKAIGKGVGKVGNKVFNSKPYKAYEDFVTEKIISPGVGLFGDNTETRYRNFSERVAQNGLGMPAINLMGLVPAAKSQFKAVGNLANNVRQGKFNQAASQYFGDTKNTFNYLKGRFEVPFSRALGRQSVLTDKLLDSQFPDSKYNDPEIIKNLQRRLGWNSAHTIIDGAATGHLGGGGLNSLRNVLRPSVFTQGMSRGKGLLNNSKIFTKNIGKKFFGPILSGGNLNNPSSARRLFNTGKPINNKLLRNSVLPLDFTTMWDDLQDNSAFVKTRDIPYSDYYLSQLDPLYRKTFFDEKGRWIGSDVLVNTLNQYYDLGLFAGSEEQYPYYRDKFTTVAIDALNRDRVKRPWYSILEAYSPMVNAGSPLLSTASQKAIAEATNQIPFSANIDDGQQNFDALGTYFNSISNISRPNTINKYFENK